jgi:class 3 adenylate cyclase
MVLHQELARFRGRRVSTTADCWLAAFLSPSRAIACADALRTAIAPLGLDLAAGIHTGECDTTTGDLSGLPVDVAVRVAALADPGQVLVTSTVKDLIAGTHLTFSLHGVAQLSSVPGEWTLYAVDNPGPPLTPPTGSDKSPAPGA